VAPLEELRDSLFVKIQAGGERAIHSRRAAFTF
jgi:hypothetical protein